MEININQFKQREPEKLVKSWKDALSKIYKEWCFVYSNYIFWARTYSGVCQSYGYENAHTFILVEKSLLLFMNDVVVHVRKTCDKDTKVRSLIGLLSSMYAHNEFFPCSIITADLISSKKKDIYENVYKNFNNSKNLTQLSKSSIIQKIENLKAIIKPVREYADKSLLHTEEKYKTETNQNDLWEATNYILELIKEMKALLFNEAISSFQTYTWDMTTHTKPIWADSKLPNNYRQSTKNKFVVFSEFKI